MGVCIGVLIALVGVSKRNNGGNSFWLNDTLISRSCKCDNGSFRLRHVCHFVKCAVHDCTHSQFNGEDRKSYIHCPTVQSSNVSWCARNSSPLPKHIFMAQENSPIHTPNCSRGIYSAECFRMVYFRRMHVFRPESTLNGISCVAFMPCSRERAQRRQRRKSLMNFTFCSSPSCGRISICLASLVHDFRPFRECCLSDSFVSVAAFERL